MLTVLTLGVLDKRLRERLDDHPYFTLQDRLDAIRMACAVWQAATASWTRTVVVPTIPGDPYVPVPGLAQVLAVRWEAKPLQPTTVEELSFIRPNWRREMAGAIGVGLSAPQYWAPIGPTTVALWPTPPRISGLSCTGVALPPPIDSTAGLTATLDLSPEWQDPLLDLAAWWAAGKGGAGMQGQYQPHLDRALAGIAARLGTQIAGQLFMGLTHARAGAQQRIPQPAAPPPPGSTEGGGA